MQKDLPAGQTAFIPLDFSNSFGPLDVYLAGTGADSTATLRGARFDLPAQLALSDLAPAQLNVQGNGALPAQPAGPFGSRTGAALYQPLTSGAPTTFSTAATSGARILLAHYREDDGVLKLVDYALPSDSGIYTLKMTVPTSNSAQFLADESAWKFANTNPAFKPGDDARVGTIPVPGRGAPMTDIIQNQLGDGSAESSFTTSKPNTTGSVDVYCFWAVTRGPVIVRTVPIDPGVNTTLHLYRARYKADGSLDYLGQINDVSSSRDWYPADRTQIDAQTDINDFETIDYDDTAGPVAEIDPYHTQGGIEML